MELPMAVLTRYITGALQSLATRRGYFNPMSSQWLAFLAWLRRRRPVMDAGGGRMHPAKAKANVSCALLGSIVLFSVAVTAQNDTTHKHTSAPQVAISVITDSNSAALSSSSSPYILNGTLQQANANFNISGNGTLGGVLAAKTVNSSTAYQISGTGVLSIGSAADGNLFLGSGAGANNIPGAGVHNTYSGFQAGYFNTTGGGNTFTGVFAGLGNTTGGQNSFFGTTAGAYNTTGYDNTFIGYNAGYYNATGYGQHFYRVRCRLSHDRQ